MLRVASEPPPPGLARLAHSPDDPVATSAALLACALGLTPRFIATIAEAARYRDSGRRLLQELHLPQDDARDSARERWRRRVMTESRLAWRYLYSDSDQLRQMAGDIAAFSRERWDGRGVPDGLQAHEIPESARIVAICATYHALLDGAHRHSPWRTDNALAYLSGQAGKRFDPHMVEVFLRRHS